MMKAALKSAFGAIFDPRTITRAANDAALKPLLQKLKIDLVLDIGAEDGAFGDLLRHQIGYTGRIASFEAMPPRFTALHTRIARDDLWQVEHASFGATGGDLNLNVIDLKDFRPAAPTRSAEPSTPHTVHLRRDTIPIRTLDDTVATLQTRHRASRIFLNLNAGIQDQDILKGCETSLATIAAIRTQLDTSRKSAGMPHHLAMLSYFEAKRFTPHHFTATTPTSFACTVINAALG